MFLNGSFLFKVFLYILQDTRVKIRVKFGDIFFISANSLINLKFSLFLLDIRR